MTTSPHGLYDQGYTRATMAGTKRCKVARRSQSQKTGLSSDWSLQLGFMKSESLVIADQHAAVNTFPGLVHTARHTMGVSCSRSGLPNPQGRAVPKEGLGTGGEWEQSNRRGTCGWITSFLETSFCKRLNRSISTPILLAFSFESPTLRL